MQRVTDSPFKAQTVARFCIRMAPGRDVPQPKPGCGELPDLTHACARSLGTAPTLTATKRGTKRNPNRPLGCARLHQVHCLLPLNYKTTTKKGAAAREQIKLQTPGVHNGW